ncbi:antiviral reverse transcriptase Drt3b [Hoeflea sp. Naph1]|uniref:antiviral reverse transcriptase Drt3b n=1 Tax=Hoeflea sp. Naph1 TaxID=3388653 RepID=UPI00398FF5E9
MSQTLRIQLKGSSVSMHKRWSLGLPEQAPGETISTPYSPSYFAYKKYLLLDRFFSSNELVRLESRFSNLRMLDVSRCFFNIYTHSITWAQKEKEFSKKNTRRYSFEQQFDELMQKSNYNETAGILVGPEVSRIFAEVILQRIDLELERRALERGLQSERDYAIRRYVDDFHIFSNSVDTLNALEDLLADELEAYKLFLNTDKREELSRPFVTGISRVKHEVGRVCETLHRSLTEKIELDEGGKIVPSNALKESRHSLDSLRFLGGSERGSFVNAFSEVFTTLQKTVRDIRAEFATGEHNDLVVNERLARIKMIIRILFYLLSVDFRVPPLIRASFLLQDIVGLTKTLPQSERAATRAYLSYELSLLLAVNYQKEKGPISLEVTNTFLLGLMVDPVSFCLQDSVHNMIQNVLSGFHKGYFAILCGLHYQNSVSPDELELPDTEVEISVRSEFCQSVAAYIASDICDPAVDCEDYLVFCDFLSCPAADHAIRWETFNKKLGGQELSKKEFDELALQFRHTNWKDKGREFDLLIRRLQPVYFSA